MKSFESVSSVEEISLRQQKPGFLHDFSKETAREERQELAARIKNMRREMRAPKEEVSSEGALLSSLENLDENGERRRAEELQALPHLDTLDIESLNPKEKMEKSARELIKEELNQFWLTEASRWMEAGYDPERIKALFTEEHLSSLSMEDYVLLLKRFPANMATHVTRQGVRDHFEGQHNVGMGEFHNGLVEILESGRLHSSLSKYLVQKDKVKAVGKFLNEELAIGHANTGNNFTDQEIAESVVDSLEKKAHLDAGSLSDRLSVHLGLETVLNRFYGAETGNECFFIYPTAHIFSQFPFDRNGPSADDFSNDLWVFTEKDGLSLNAGILFLPKSTPVDPRTGSRYEVIEGKVELNNSALTTLEGLVSNQQFPAFIDELKDLNTGVGDRREIINKLGQDFGVDNADIEYAFTNPELVSFIQEKLKSNFFSSRSLAEKIAQYSGILYKRPQELVPSKDYWEKVFANNPELRPSKVVYYEGEPTVAVEEWRQKNGIAPSPRLQAKMAGIDFIDNNLKGPRLEEYEQRFDNQKKDFVEIARQALEQDAYSN